MDPPARKEKSKVKEPVSRVEKAKQKSAQQELKQRQRAEIHPSTRQVNCKNKRPFGVLLDFTLQQPNKIKYLMKSQSKPNQCKQKNAKVVFKLNP
uniref:Small vasohibin-binding protein n=1 Tax=Canis lupus dingo TaxID=286419 RepID=A0A8C0QVC1_CANLU